MVEHILQQVVQAHTLALRAHATHLELTDIEQVAHQRIHAFQLVLNNVERLDAQSFVGGARATQHLGVHADYVQGRLQLVRDMGDEIIAGLLAKMFTGDVAHHDQRAEDHRAQAANQWLCCCHQAFVWHARRCELDGDLPAAFGTVAAVAGKQGAQVRIMTPGIDRC